MVVVKLKAFVGHSFSLEDEPVVKIFIHELETFKKLGLEFETGEESEGKPVAEKVKARFEDKQVFIGIFTRKHPISRWCSTKLNSTDRAQYWNFIFRKINAWATSGWTLQESGYAIAKDMKLILLLEDGVIDIGGLHGDWEIIPFSRKNPGACLPKLREQITNLLAQPEGLAESPGTQLQPSVPESKEDKDEKYVEKASKQGGEPDRLSEIARQLFRERDQSAAEKIYQQWISEAPKEDLVYRKAAYQNLRFNTGLPDSFKAMEALAEEYPQHPLPLSSLGHFLGRLGQPSRAADHFQRAAALENDPDIRAKLVVSAAKQYVKNNQHDDAMCLLKTTLDAIKNNHIAESTIYVGMADVALAQKNAILEISLLEKALSVDPADHKTRFRLGFKYAEIKNHASAIHHYLVLTREFGDDTGLNNLGVSYEMVGLLGKAVAAYKRAEKAKVSLAMANLAQKLIGVGFFEEAMGYIEKGLAVEDPHPNLGAARTRIKETEEEEEKKEQGILEGTIEERNFRIAFSDAFCVPRENVPDINGAWKTPRGQIEITVVGDFISGGGTFKQRDQGLIAALSSPGQPKYVTKTIIISGRLEGATATGIFAVDTTPEDKLVFATTSGDFNIYLVIQSKNNIKAMLVDVKDKISIVAFERA